MQNKKQLNKDVKNVELKINNKLKSIKINNK